MDISNGTFHSKMIGMVVEKCRLRVLARDTHVYIFREHFVSEQCFVVA